MYSEWFAQGCASLQEWLDSVNTVIPDAACSDWSARGYASCEEWLDDIGENACCDSVNEAQGNGFRDGDVDSESEEDDECSKVILDDFVLNLTNGTLDFDSAYSDTDNPLADITRLKQYPEFRRAAPSTPQQTALPTAAATSPSMSPPTIAITTRRM